MDIDREEKLLLMEVKTLAAEMMTKAVAVLSDKNEKNRDRRQMAVALAGASRDLSLFLPENGPGRNTSPWCNLSLLAWRPLSRSSNQTVITATA